MYLASQSRAVREQRVQPSARPGPQERLPTCTQASSKEKENTAKTHQNEETEADGKTTRYPGYSESRYPGYTESRRYPGYSESHGGYLLTEALKYVCVWRPHRGQVGSVVRLRSSKLASRQRSVIPVVPPAVGAQRPGMLNTRGVREYNTIKYTFYVPKYVYSLVF